MCFVTLEGLLCSHMCLENTYCKCRIWSVRLRSKVFKTIRKSVRYLDHPYLTESAPTAPSAPKESSSSEGQDKFWSTSENKLLQNEDELLQDSELICRNYRDYLSYSFRYNRYNRYYLHTRQC